MISGFSRAAGRGPGRRPGAGALAVLLLCAAGIGAADAAPPTDLLRYKWRAAAATEKKTTEIALTQADAGVAVTVKNLAGNQEETAPHLSVDLGGLQDWRAYQTLRCRMRLTSDAATVMANGKPIAFCFYDQRTRHEMFNVPVQQEIDLRLNAGEWQDITLNLRPFGRSQISAFDIYLYVTPYGITHQYKIEISKFELVKDDRPMFDGEGMSGPLAVADDGKGPEQRLAAGSGLELRLNGHGRIVGVDVGGQKIGGAGPGGVLVRDLASDAPPVPAGGEPVREGDDWVERADLASRGLAVESRYRAEGDRIHVSLKVANRNKETRLLTLYFALPLRKNAWQWGNDINGNEAIPAGSRRPYEETTSLYPVASLAAPDAGIALAVPLDQPRNYRLAYNERTGLFYAAFDLALADIGTADGRSLNEAACDVYVYPCDPQWGFRSALQNYYAAFPQWFAKRTPRDGGWEMSGARKDLTPEQVIASGCRFDWGTGFNRAAWNRQNGILNSIYIEPEYIQLTMTDLEPSDQAALSRLRNLTAGDAAEWAKMEPLHYSQAYKGSSYANEHSLFEFHRLLARAALVSGLVTAEGRPRLDVGYRPGWIGENGLGMMVPCNLDPAIPGGRGQAAFELMDANARWSAERGQASDGWALDSYVCDENYDYRAENFRYSPFPLTFERDRRQPAVPIRFTFAEWTKELAARGAAAHKIIFGNLVGNVTFSAPYLDVFGTENGWVDFPAYQRSMAYHRPVNYLPYTPKPDLGVFFNLLYGIYPGRGLDQAQYEAMVPVLDAITPAGWEPVTDARVDAPKVRVERFGSGDRCYLAFYNSDATARSFRVRVDAAALHTSFRQATVLFGPRKGDAIPAAEEAFPLRLGSRETCVVQLN